MRTILPALLLSACCAAGGCQGSDVYQRAGALAVEIRGHRDHQATRVSNLNAEFDARYSALMDQYETALNDQLRQGREANAQEIADRLIVNLENNALRGKFREAFAGAVAEQRRAIAGADEALAAARAAYETSYQQASLELRRLDRVHELLLELAAAPSQMAAASQAIRMTIDAYQKAQEAKGDAKPQPDAGSGTGGSPGTHRPTK